MIITKTPFRVSFVGGGTDLPNYFERFGGAVVSCAINKYVYVTISKRDDDRIVVVGRHIETVSSPEQLTHSIAKECLRKVGIREGIEIHFIADFSTIGTGLGGSSAITVGLLNALYHYVGHPRQPEEIALEACAVETGIGKQDQYACAIGGLNLLKFKANGSVEINRLSHNFAGNMFLLPYLDQPRRAEELLKVQNERFDQNIPLLHKLKTLCDQFWTNIKKPKRLIKIINDGWGIKKELSPLISDSQLDDIIVSLQRQGWGTKLCGAGGNGYILVYGNGTGYLEGAIKVKVSPDSTVARVV
ncbi:MAG: hypothetical protein QME51_07115 [Planctomycetota bacterium]|nr:hypothetical protein [Planctomycetota bacterium]